MPYTYDDDTGIGRDLAVPQTGEVLYVSGGMTGFPRFNFDIFDDCELALTRLGHATVSPAQHDRSALRRTRPGVSVEDLKGFADGTLSWYYADAGFVHEDLLGWDLTAIVTHCTGIVMLPAWQRSTGAKWERVAAEATAKKVLLAKYRAGDQGYKALPGEMHWKFELDTDQLALTNFMKAVAA